MKKIAILLGILQSIVAIGAIPAGLSFLFEPDGSGIGISIVILDGTPFQDYYIPGLFLLLVLGLGNLIGAVLSFKKSRLTGIIGIGLGIILLLWIVIQVYFIGLINFLQPLFFVIAIIEIIFGIQFWKNGRKE